MGGKSGKQPTVSTYYAGIDFVLCHGPVDKVLKIKVDDRIAWEGENLGTTISVNAPELFGGPDREGGISGDIDMAFGASSQTPNTYLTNLLGNVSAYRGIVRAILNRVYLGNNYYLKPWKFTLSRLHTRKTGIAQWQDAYAEVGTNSGLINAVHVVRDCLTDTTWGYGFPDANIDETSFLSSATTCYNEGLGFSFMWDGGDLTDFIVKVLSHIQGNVYQDRATGKIHLTLLRQIADPLTVPLLDDTNVVDVPKLEKSLLQEIPSLLTIRFKNKETEKTDSVTVGNIAVYQKQGVPVSKTITYDGCRTIDVAEKLALRDLKAASTPIYSGTIICNRDAEVLNKGDAFRLYQPDIVDETLLMRVVSISLGTATNSKITIDCMQDVFQATDAITISLPSSAWVDPISEPQALTYRVVLETPYYVIAKNQGDTFAQALATTDSFIVVGGVSPTSDSISAAIYTTTGTTYVRNGGMDFCSSGILTSTITKTTTSIDISNPVDLDYLELGSFIQIDDEYLGVTNIVGTTLTVIRGCLDTVPEDHALGARFLGWYDYAGSDNITYVLTEVVKVKLATITGKGELALASAPEDTVTINGRPHLPYPPGNLQINSLTWPASITSSADIILTWASRNRFQQTANLIDYYSGDITSEPSITYSGELIRTDTLAVLASFTGIATLTTTLTGVTYIGEAKLTVRSTNPNGSCLQEVTHIFNLV